MFWALKGATRRPRRANKRHSPATRVLLPAVDAVPCTMSTGASTTATRDSRDGFEQPLTLLEQAAGAAHAVEQTIRLANKHVETSRQTSTAETSAITIVIRAIHC